MPQSRARIIILWILQILAAVAFLAAGGSKLASAAQMVGLFEKIGFGQWFRYLTGLLEVVGAIGLLIPRYALHAALLLAIVMVGAVIAHLEILGGSPVPALVLLAIVSAVAWLRKPKGELTMKIALYGATGKSGSRILKELLSRGHQVVAVTRDASKLKPENGVSIKQDNLSNANKTAEVIKGADAVISAYAPPPGNTGASIDVTRLQVDAVKKAGVNRLLVVGGAGGLEVAPGVSLIQSGHLPEAYLPNRQFPREGAESPGKLGHRLDVSSPSRFL